MSKTDRGYRGTYPTYMKFNGKRYRFRSRAYATNIIQGKRAKDALVRFAKRERERGHLTRIIFRDNTWWLYIHEKPKKKGK